jgi:hypothetical protein
MLIRGLARVNRKESPEFVGKEQGLMVNDPIADMLARLRNAAEIKHPQVLMPARRIR